jgi:hypothetical protein
MHCNVLSCFVISIVTVAPPSSVWPAAIACAGACADASSLHHCQLIPGSPFTFTIQEVDATMPSVDALPRQSCCCGCSCGIEGVYKVVHDLESAVDNDVCYFHCSACAPVFL